MSPSESAGFSLQDILLLIGMQSRTGELVLEAGNNIGSLIFHNGAILQAFCPYRREIGDLLVEGGIITETELLEALKMQKQNAITPIGKVFVSSGKVSFEIIEAMVHEQIRKSVKEFSGWGATRMSFVGKDIQPCDRIRLAVNEFLTPDAVQSAQFFFSSLTASHEKSASSAASAA